MALNLSINLSNATFADLAALVEASKQAGAAEDTALHLTTGEEGVVVTIVVDAPNTGPTTPAPHADKITRRASEDTEEFFDAAGHFSDQVRETVTTGSDATLRLIAELLRGGSHDPRRR